MKHRFLYIMALLLTVATGAWAQDPDPIDLTPSADGTVWTLSTMPEYDVELEVTYYTDEEVAEMEEAAYTEGVELTDNGDGTWTLASSPGFDIELEVEYETYDVILAEGSEANGTVALTVGGEPATSASPGEVVTVTVTPAEGYLVTGISAEAYTTWNAERRRTAPDNIPIYGDIDLTPVENVANTWTFTMPAANVEVTVAYAKVYTVHVRTGRFATFYADENVELAAETPQGVTLHTITSVTNTEAVVGSEIEGIVAAGTPLLVYNGTDADQTVTIFPATEQPANSLIWDEKFKGTAEDKIFDEAAMQSADYYALSGGQCFAIVQGTGTLSANQCWLQFDKQASAGVRQIKIVSGEETGISLTPSPSLRGEGSIYSLDGRRVANGQWSIVNGQLKKGVYVHNGKKVVIK